MVIVAWVLLTELGAERTPWHASEAHNAQPALSLDHFIPNNGELTEHTVSIRILSAALCYHDGVIFTFDALIGFGKA